MSPPPRDPFSGSHFKIIWANQHLDLVKQVCRDYVGIKPYRYPAQSHEDFVVVHRPVIVQQPFLDIGGHIGDCLTNTMASLDYIIWNLAERHAGRPLVPPQSDGVKPVGGYDTPSFPLYIDRAEFLNATAKNMRWKRYNFPANVEADIDGVQPYNAGYEPLALLYRLVNQDKHRDRLITTADIESGDIHIIRDGVAESPIASSAERAVFKAPYPPDTPVHERKVEVNSQVTTRVTWADTSMPTEPVEVTLYNILKCVNGVYNIFTKHLIGSWTVSSSQIIP